jgi:2-polyprenyl-3-methyl-5-hydroxy-6-metoxy-1,4-benzoquinol methylase
LARLGGNVLGIDASKENIEIAMMHAKNEPLFAIQQNEEPRLLYRCTTAGKTTVKSKENFQNSH